MSNRTDQEIINDMDKVVLNLNALLYEASQNDIVIDITQHPMTEYGNQFSSLYLTFDAKKIQYLTSKFTQTTGGF